MEKNEPPPDVPSYHKLWEMSKHLDANQAAKVLRVGITKFKSICRDSGIAQWPYRKFQSYYALQGSAVTTRRDKVNTF